MTQIEGLTYDYEWSPDQGTPGCPKCDDKMVWVGGTSPLRYLECDDCGLICDTETSLVYEACSCGNPEPHEHERSSK